MSKPYKFKITTRELEVLVALDKEQYLSEVSAKLAAAGETASTPGAVSSVLKRLVVKGLATEREEENRRYRSGHRVYYQRSEAGNLALQQPV